jgi:hypothetical protein
MSKQVHLNQHLPQAPRAPLLAIEGFLAPYHVLFRERKGTENLERYVTGLVNEHPNKNCGTLAGMVPGTHPQPPHKALLQRSAEGKCCPWGWDLSGDSEGLGNQAVWETTSPRSAPRS